MKRVIITGSEGVVGSELTKFFTKKKIKVFKLDKELGHDLTDEKFVKKWFKENKADHLVNCFALNDHIDKKINKKSLFNIPLDVVSEYFRINLTSLFSVCREYSKDKKIFRINSNETNVRSERIE
jgi:dTDP-4-dehydrorhamnose reductase